MDKIVWLSTLVLLVVYQHLVYFQIRGLKWTTCLKAGFVKFTAW